jgi:DNA-binding response OmpR family regulator
MPKRVLVVDDDPALSALLTEGLARAGHSVSAVDGGQQCLDAVAQERPDLVILDAIMPGMDGFEVLRQLRQDGDTRLLPVIMLTGRGGHDAELQGWMAGAHRYLTKPCQVSAVVEAVQAMLAETSRPPERD